MTEAYELEALERDVPPLDPNISDVDLEAHICDVVLRLIKLGSDMIQGPRDDSQLDALDQIADELTAAFHIEQARRVAAQVPTAEGDA